MTDDEWEAMSGSALASILALPEHSQALQAALDGARDNPAECDVQALAVLKALGADPHHSVIDAFTNRPSSRLEVLTEELTRARFEEN